MSQLLEKTGVIVVPAWAFGDTLKDAVRLSYGPLVHNLNGTLIGMVHIMLPFLILPLYSSMKAISPDYLKAASNLGATPSQSFWQVFFPLSLPGLFAGSLIVFVLCLGFFVTPAVLGGGKVIMVSNQITNNIELFFNWGAASALGVVLLVLTLLILVFSEIIPKTLGAHYWKQLAPLTAYLLQGLIWILYPFVKLSAALTRGLSHGPGLSGFNREELAVMAELSASEGQLDQQEIFNQIDAALSESWSS